MRDGSVVVVGGGLAGLVAALSCARAGWSTTLYEGSGLGGRGSTDVVDGFRFDRGAHALFGGGAAERGLGELGVVVPAEKAFTTGSAVVIAGEVVPFPDHPLALARASWLGLAGRAALVRFLLEVGLGTAPTAQTAADWLDTVADGPGRTLARALTRVSTYCGDLERLDGRVAAHQVHLGTRYGVKYVQGGWQSMVDALAAAARAAGVTLHSGVPVRSVTADREVRTDRGGEQPDHVILAVPPDRAEELLGRKLPPRPPPARVAALQLALADEVVQGGPRRLVLSDDPPVFVSNFSAVTPLGPRGAQVVHAIRYGTAATARADIEGVLDAAYPRWRSGVVAERWLPSMVTVSSLPGPGAGRLPIDACGVPGLWLAGDGYGPDGHLADAAFASARACAHHLGASVACSAA